MYYVYVIENSKGGLYIGHTDDVARRLREHNDIVGKSHLRKYTHKHAPWSLLGIEIFSSRSEAMNREHQLKSWKSSVRLREHFQAENSGRVPTESGLITWS